MTVKSSRRSFLKGTATLMLVAGFDISGGFAVAAKRTEAFTPFIQVSVDGNITVVVKHFECGQGTVTGLTTLVAEELDVSLEAIKAEFAPADATIYGHTVHRLQLTGGSTSMSNSFLQYRDAAATVRQLLVRSAASRWNCSEADIQVQNGLLSTNDQQGHFGEFISDALKLDPHSPPKLKARKEFRYIGNPEVARKDSSTKVDGTAIFGMDVRLPGMLYAAVLRSPKAGGKLKDFDASDVEGMAGFVTAQPLLDGSGVVVYAQTTWDAFSARQKIQATWDFTNAEQRSSTEIEALHRKMLQIPQHQVFEDYTTSDASTDLGNASKIVDLQFFAPYLAQAPMEPLNVTIEPTSNGGLRIHEGCQSPSLVQMAVSKALKLDQEKIEISTVYAGGSFGRRGALTADYHVEAVLAFIALDGQTPVKVVWSREDDLSGADYRPIAATSVRLGFNDTGDLNTWDLRLTTQSNFIGSPFEKYMVNERGIDASTFYGLAETTYAFPKPVIGLSYWNSSLKTGAWRSVAHSYTAHALEIIVDVMAQTAGQDPLAYRLSLLTDTSNLDQQRLANVIKLAAKQADWEKPLPKGWGRGVAAHKSFGTFVAEIVEVSTDNGQIKIERVVAAVDCGLAVNPDIIVAQMEGAIGYGIGAAMRNQVTLKNGEVEQNNFPDYEPLRIGDIGNIEIHIAPSEEPPTGIGEPGTPPAAPALANAIFNATGQRATRLPLTANGIVFA
ncbi:Membrane-bound aldehyde dehydrogenase [pyrroloquinoline-quinone] precursor [Pseudovibrio sp. Ad46]|uniref:xanthine dehydrogenase family protein molybdopterin-binding subunit n=1 Tax=Pseudovibrio sp. Ad46 TaxID=989432 RepID=UPI0007AE41F4|nr:molybdopterin cofactor-binding domain-containing protein [Pseudovibrio sp. Ad46]KZK80177.1 Membrane-bound aldehyde dehydrogenase [pyrroloquinoline-quinone] precursor [Pseudovibrio sp. Ad46]